MSKHTPGPWRATIGDGRPCIMAGPTRVASLNRIHPKHPDEEAHNAAYIVHACNAYPKLVEALNNLLVGVSDYLWSPLASEPRAAEILRERWDSARQLLAECEEA